MKQNKLHDENAIIGLLSITLFFLKAWNIIIVHDKVNMPSNSCKQTFLHKKDKKLSKEHSVFTTLNLRTECIFSLNSPFKYTFRKVEVDMKGRH